jgi:hypothetical protein
VTVPTEVYNSGQILQPEFLQLSMQDDMSQPNQSRKLSPKVKRLSSRIPENCFILYAKVTITVKS